MFNPEQGAARSPELLDGKVDWHIICAIELIYEKIT